jgi:hypothetical protein
VRVTVTRCGGAILAATQPVSSVVSRYPAQRRAG